MTAPISSNINSIQFFNATNAFKTATAKKPEKPAEDLFSDDMAVPEQDNNALSKYNLDEIKQYAQGAGEANLSNEDIKYGITYGRSVIADYSV